MQGLRELAGGTASVLSVVSLLIALPAFDVRTGMELSELNWDD
jgi:hypothetical protein